LGCGYKARLKIHPLRLLFLPLRLLKKWHNTSIIINQAASQSEPCTAHPSLAVKPALQPSNNRACPCSSRPVTLPAAAAAAGLVSASAR